ncbi:membrane-associated phospholipid phosphatase [Spirosoma oryzae]|uniref:Membrane-associated phospholipid phosphatase n=1 Tax=Spirosoma oryzae TaxID=1469603 RepID=A0A2T0THV0_9BACT|nr:phosphatase PAP2 family protein [Spirosoma oryzae]PRY45286.1 membrane-associated phospholipid phosphatase [Spirosoma oryzae]
MVFRIIRANYAFFLPYLLLLIVVGVLQLTRSQEQLMQWVNVRNAPAADEVFPYVTYLGDGVFFVLVCLLLAINNRRIGLMAFASFALSSLVSLFLKQVVFSDSLRPLKTFEHSTYQYHIIKGLDIHSYNSFPSGHTTSAFALFGMLALLDERKGRGWFFLVIAALTGYSRVYLFQHFVEDAYVGSTIGTVSTVVVYLLMYRWVAQDQKKGRPTV